MFSCGPLAAIPITLLIGRLLLTPLYFKWRYEGTKAGLFLGDRIELENEKVKLLTKLNELTDHSDSNNNYIEKDDQLNQIRRKIREKDILSQSYLLLIMPMAFMQGVNLSLVKFMTPQLESYQIMIPFLNSNIFHYNENLAITASKCLVKNLYRYCFFYILYKFQP